MFGPGEIASGGLLLDSFVISISGLTGRQVVNRTGLQGFYALTLHYAVRGLWAQQMQRSMIATRISSPHFRNNSV